MKRFWVVFWVIVALCTPPIGWIALAAIWFGKAAHGK